MIATELLPRPALVVAGSVVALLAAIGLAASAGLILGNATPSVPRGLYLKADPADATYVTFCLGRRHGAAEWYGHFCSPDNPAGVPILKRIAERGDVQCHRRGRRAARPGQPRPGTGPPERDTRMVAAADPDGSPRAMATDAMAKERGPIDPANVLGDMETLDALDAEIARVREREEARLIRLARKAGFFDVRMKERGD